MTASLGSIGFLLVAASYGVLLDRFGDRAFPWLCLPLFAALAIAIGGGALGEAAGLSEAVGAHLAGILLSGLYDLAPVEHASFVNVDLKLTPARIDRLSPARLPQSHSIPFFTAVGALESDEFKRQNALIGTVWPDTHTGDIALPACNHLTICDAFATPGHPLFETALTLASIAR